MEALKSNDRWALQESSRAASAAEDLSGRVRALSGDVQLTPDLLRQIAARRLCPEESRCALLRLDSNRLILLVSSGEERSLGSHVLDLREPVGSEAVPPAPAVQGVDLGRARIELRPVTRRQLYVDGKPVGQPIA